MFAILVVLAIAFTEIATQWANPEPAKKLINIWQGTYECEGKDSANYTHLAAQSTDGQCSQESIVTFSDQLIVCKANGEKTVIGLLNLAHSQYPAGADYIYEGLYLATSGPLEGKYAFLRIRYLSREYLKTCSSVLGQSVIVIKGSELLISDKLEPNDLISATGVYNSFKKGCTTICKGNELGV